ncbi:unnamed protein product [Linum trigynum]|uniref:Uncharacterized protein n=1 Tax=Linum trigynum TaxID=586398 RepID=A0AAV2GBN7_9ROSI
MAETNKLVELLTKCWESIRNSLDRIRSFESLSLVFTQFLSITNHHSPRLFPAHLFPNVPVFVPTPYPPINAKSSSPDSIGC